MRLKLVFALLFSLACAGRAFAQQEYLLPQVADGVFAGGSFRMTFVAVNNGDVQAIVIIALTDDNGSPLLVTIPGLGTQSQFVVTLGAGSTQLLQTSGTGPLRQGAAKVTSTAPVSVSAIFSVYDSNGNFLTEAGVGSSPAGTEFVIPVDTTGNFNTGAAFFNGGFGTANLTIVLFNSAGQEMLRTTDTLAARRHNARFIAGLGQIFPTATNFRGTAVVTSSSNIALIVLRQNSSPLSYTSLPALLRTAGKTTINLSHVANGTFSGGSFRTTFPIFNPSAATANVTVTLNRDDGSPFPVTMIGRGTNSTFILALAPGASAFLETDGTGTLAGGSATITSTVPVGASAIFSVFNPQGGFLTEAGVGDAAALTELTLPVDISASSDTGVAFFNPGGATITLTIRLLEGGGGVVGTVIQVLGPRAHVPRFVTEYFPGQTSFRGSLAITSAGGGVAAITLRQNAAPLTYTTLPVATGVSRGTTPAPATTLVAKSRTGVTITANTTVDESLSPGFKISGTINGFGTIYARAGDGVTAYGGGINLVSQRYVIGVPAGTYQIFVCQFTLSGTTNLSSTYTDPTPVQVSADTTRNITLPTVATVAVSGAVSGVSGPLASNAFLVLSMTDRTALSTIQLGTGGAYQAQLPAGAYTATLMAQTPIAGGGFSSITLYNLGSVTVGSSATTANFTVPATARISGTVRVPGLASLPTSTVVTASDQSAAPPAGTLALCGFPPNSSSMTAGGAGAFQLTVTSGRSNTLGVRVPIVSNETILGNVSFNFNPSPFNVTGDTTRDLTLPALPALVTLSGRVTGPTGQPLADISVSAFTLQVTGAPEVNYGASSSTDSSGNYRMMVMSGTNYMVTFFPPLAMP